MIQESLLLRIQKPCVNDVFFSKLVWRHHGSQTFHIFQDVVYLCAANSALEPQSCVRRQQRSLMLAFAGSAARREQMDRLGIFPVRILSLPTPAFEKIVPLSHSVTLICYFLWNNWLLVRARFLKEMLCGNQMIFVLERMKLVQPCKITWLLSWMQVETSLNLALQF